MQHDRYSSAKGAGAYATGRIDKRERLDEEYDDETPSRLPSSVQRYRSDVQFDTDQTHADVQSLAQEDQYSSFNPARSAVPPRRTAVQGRGQRRSVDTEDIMMRKPSETGEHIASGRRRMYWLVYMGLGLLIMMVGWVVLSMVTNWWQMTQDDWHYGRPRTAQYDVAVDHNDSVANPSHFIALNLRRRIEIMECPGGDCSKAKIYVGPALIGQGQDLSPVTLSFKDVNEDGKVDMIVSVQDSRIVFLNENGAFRPQRPGENIQLN